MADDERRAEIEAVALDEFATWLKEWRDGIDVYDPATQGIYDALDAVLVRFGAALDRVRDARGDDEVQKAWDEGRHPFGPGTGQAVTQTRYEAARSPQDEDHECIYESDADGDLACPVCGRYADSGDEAADAQDEDHEPETVQTMKYLSSLKPPLPPQDEDHETIRPEQPPPDKLGGQPPAEPKTP